MGANCLIVLYFNSSKVKITQTVTIHHYGMKKHRQIRSNLSRIILVRGPPSSGYFLLYARRLHTDSSQVTFSAHWGHVIQPNAYGKTDLAINYDFRCAREVPKKKYRVKWCTQSFSRHLQLRNVNRNQIKPHRMQSEYSPSQSWSSSDERNGQVPLSFQLSVYVGDW